MRELEIAKKELRTRLWRRMPQQGSYETAIPGVGIHRRDTVNDPGRCLYTPRIVYIFQGRKHTTVGREEYFYGEDDLFIAGVDLPNTSNLIEASPKKPAMSLTIDLDNNLIAQLALEMPPSISIDITCDKSAVVQPIDSKIVDAFLRLESLLDAPEEVPVLGPMILKEIHFRLLIGPNGNLLRSFHTFGTQRNQVAQAISWVRQHFREAFQVEDLAERVHMAPSTFPRHFKEITSLSPLQFQKRLRLHEAQRLMLGDDLDISNACDAVGYESLTQFNREYKRLFGEPPRRNITRWQSDHLHMPALVAAE
ncbi:MAG: AraC family transcriptional regulator [Planctomycetaceae bacterium]|nr:AraC family transcriptional regulator [Planctomycetaceae bacterium]